MDSIQLMMDEHENIRRMLQVVRKACYKMLKGETVCYEDFDKIIDFIRNYADKHHHGKEEKFLFNRMTEHLGALGEKLVKMGMLVEHDLGRLYVQELELALERVKLGDEESRLDVIANAISYTHLLERHISKENDVVYTFAKRQLAEEILRQVDEDCEVFEKECESKSIQNNYLKNLDNLERKYC